MARARPPGREALRDNALPNNPVLYADPLGLDTVNMNKLQDGQRLPFGSVLDFGNGVYINWTEEFYTRYFMAEAQVYGRRNSPNMTATGSTAGQAALAQLMAGMAEANGIAAQTAANRARAAEAQLQQLMAMAAEKQMNEGIDRIRERYGNGDALDPSTVGNWLDIYTGPNNPLKFSGDPDYSLPPRNLSDYVSIIHDQDYDNMGLSGPWDVVTKPRAIGADWKFVRNQYKAGFIMLNYSVKDAAKAFTAGTVIGGVAIPKTILYYHSKGVEMNMQMKRDYGINPLDIGRPKW